MKKVISFPCYIKVHGPFTEKSLNLRLHFTQNTTFVEEYTAEKIIQWIHKITQCSSIQDILFRRPSIVDPLGSRLVD